MTANHTPGPWEYAGSRIYADFKSGVELATLAQLAPEQTRANGRLMAAAPEMLAMLEDILLRGSFISNRIKPLIKKARGQE